MWHYYFRILQNMHEIVIWHHRLLGCCHQLVTYFVGVITSYYNLNFSFYLSKNSKQELKVCYSTLRIVFFSFLLLDLELLENINKMYYKIIFNIIFIIWMIKHFEIIIYNLCITDLNNGTGCKRVGNGWINNSSKVSKINTNYISNAFTIRIFLFCKITKESH